MEPNNYLSYVRDITIVLSELYPIEFHYNSRASLYGEALRDGIITQEEYISATQYYGNLWIYIGD